MHQLSSAFSMMSTLRCQNFTPSKSSLPLRKGHILLVFSHRGTKILTSLLFLQFLPVTKREQTKHHYTQNKPCPCCQWAAVDTLTGSGGTWGRSSFTRAAASVEVKAVMSRKSCKHNRTNSTPLSMADELKVETHTGRYILTANRLHVEKEEAPTRYHRFTSSERCQREI